MVNPVIQEEISGCGIASVAAIAGLSYQSTKVIANKLGIFAEDQSLWSSSVSVRLLLSELDVAVHNDEQSFTAWDALPDCALLSIKWHLEKGKPYWHWTVFVRDSSGTYVLDSKKGLKKNRRTDFGRMKPKWFIEVML